MSFSSGAYFGSHSTVSQWARSASAARLALLVWIGPLSRTRTRTRGLDRNSELGPIAPVDLLQESDEVRASFGPAGAHDELAPRPVEHAEHRHFGALARGRNAQVGPFLGPDMRQIGMGEGFGLVAEQEHDVARLG